MKPLAALTLACCALGVSQTLRLRDEISPQALQLAKADYASMNAMPSAHISQVPADIEQELLVHAQTEIDAEGDRFSEKSPGANDMKLYYLLRVTRATKRALAAASVTGKPDNHLLGRAYTCDLLAKTTIAFGKFQGWKLMRDGPACLDVPDNGRLQEANVAQQKLISELTASATP